MTCEIINISNLKVLLTPLRPLSLKSKWRFSFPPPCHLCDVTVEDVCITNYSTGIRLPTLSFNYSWVCMTQERGDIPNKVISGTKAPPTFSNLLHMRGSQSEEKCLKREINSLFNIEDNLRGFLEVQHEINKDYFEL